MALGDLIVGNVHQPDLGLLVPGLTAEDLDNVGREKEVVREDAVDEEGQKMTVEDVKNRQGG